MAPEIAAFLTQFLGIADKFINIRHTHGDINTGTYINQNMPKYRVSQKWTLTATGV